MSNEQDRMLQKKWGIFNHFLFDEPGDHPKVRESTRDGQIWDERVQKLDTERIARTVHETGAGYYCITVMQGRRFMLAPNAAFDRIAGTKPGEACAQRDVIADLARDLGRYDIDLYLYFTGDGPYADEAIGRRFGFTEPRGQVTAGFVEKWAQVLQEYAVRYGDRVKGWWIDGCYAQWFGYTDELLERYDQAVKAGNPRALTAYNVYGVQPELRKGYRGESFTAGEFNEFSYIPDSRFLDGAQAHILAPLGLPAVPGTGGWRQPGCQISAAGLRSYIQAVNAAGGVVTVDIAISPDGSFDREQIDTLRQMNLSFNS